MSGILLSMVTEVFCVLLIFHVILILSLLHAHSPSIDLFSSSFLSLLLFVISSLFPSLSFMFFDYSQSSHLHSSSHCYSFHSSKISSFISHSSPYPQASNDRRLLLQMTTLLEDMNTAAEDTALLRAMPRSQDL